MQTRYWIASLFVAGAALTLAGATPTHGAPLVPGTGQKIEGVGDDFEDPEWTYIFNNPKSSLDIDKQTRPPSGRSKNGRWRENLDRGHPDIVKRVPTPEGGLPGSEGALLLASKATGIPGQPTRKGEQDDIFLNVNPILHHYIPVSQGPSLVVRVYVPPFEQWEAHSGSSFAVRVTLRGLDPEKENKSEPYWPGIFVNYKSPANRRKNEAPAHWVIRASKPGGDYGVKPLTEPGWYTLGMSFTGDGMIHYFIRQGIEDLTSADRVASQFPYNFQAVSFIDVFFDVFGSNDNQTWTTGWVIDDPAVYLAYPPRVQHAVRGQRKPR